tara:strand:+ start:466 stop:963 length:498 start_codon:yes stop_codon:yes gene_type:complete
MPTTTSFGESPDAITAIDDAIVRQASINVTYGNLSVPAEATVNGITVTWNGGYSAAIDANEEVMLVAYAGSSNSSILAPNETEVPYYSNTGQITFGGSTNLWGLTWTPAQAEAINTKMFTSGFGKTFYHDAFQVTIHYSLPEPPIGGMLSISQGKVVIGPGKIVL